MTKNDRYFTLYPMIIDVLRRQLVHATTPSEKITISNTLAWELLDINAHETIALGQEALAIIRHNGLENVLAAEMAQAWLNIGAGYERLAEYQLAMPFLADAAAAFEQLDHDDGLINATNGIGIVFLHIGDYASFLEYAFQALALCHAFGNEEREVVLLNNIGHGYLRQRKYEEALPYIEQSLALAETLQLIPSQGDAHDNLCRILAGLGKYEAAVAHGWRSIAFYEQAERSAGLAEAWNSLGDVYLHRGAFETAVFSFHQSYQIAQKIGHRFEAVAAQLHLGKAWLAQEQYDKAKEAGLHALKQANTINSPALQYKSHYLLYQIACGLDNVAEALAHHIQYHEFMTVVFNQEADARKSALEAIYKVQQAQKETEIYQLKSVVLEQEIAERERIAAALQQQNEELNAFAQTVAHDLKSPIGLMVSFAELLHDDLANLAPETVAQIAESIYAGGYKMVEIIDALLLLAGVRSQQVTPEPIDTTAVVAEAHYRLQAEIEAKQGVITKPDTFPPVLGYAPWLEQVWKNYISNGLKYGGTPPHLTLGFTTQENGFIRFWVQDNGAGLTPAQQDRLFVEFTRLAHDKAKGHGLGLAIVRRIVEKLNGRVGVESVLGEGCLFYYELPGVAAE